MSWGNTPQNFNNPYSSAMGAPQGPQTQNLKDKTIGPGIALIVVGVIGLLGIMIHYPFALINATAMDGPPPGMPEAQRAGYYAGFYAVFIGEAVVGLLQILIIVGGVGLLQLKWKGLAITASILSVIPCISSCCFLGIPFGVWALVVLNDPALKNAFR